MCDLKDKIKKLKKERNAIILAHYYENDEIQEIADYVGDSYYLSKIGKECKEDIIVFCGVRFMGESAKILSTEKTVILPNINAGCSMADMVTEQDVKSMKEKHPNAKVVCYINSSAEVKAQCDICCTSSNAVKIINNIKEKEIIFLPDRNLGEYIGEQVKEKDMILWDGFCCVHEHVLRDEIVQVKNEIKDIRVLVHPECNREIRELADFIGSTLDIINYATEDSNNKFMIVTEEGILYELKKKNPNKEFITPKTPMVCYSMKLTKIEDVYNSLVNLGPQIQVNENTRQAAYKCLNNMHELAR